MDNLEILKQNLDTAIDPNAGIGEILAQEHNDMVTEFISKQGKYVGSPFNAKANYNGVANAGDFFINGALNDTNGISIVTAQRTNDLNDFSIVLNTLGDGDVMHLKDFVGRSFYFIFKSYAEAQDNNGNTVYELQVVPFADNINYTYQPQEIRLCIVDFLKSNNLSFIPLSGTEEGSPVTGDIEMQEYTKIKWRNGDYFLEIENIDEYMQLKVHNEDYSEIGMIRISPFEIFTDNIIKSVIDHSETTPENKLIYAQRSYVDKANSYSTDETLTGGTWIDGKPIYRKTFVGVMPIPANTVVDIINEDLVGLNIENIFLEFISITQIDDETTYLDTSSFLQQNGNFDNASILLSYNNLRYITRTNYATTDLKVSLAIKYTKTTD